MNKNTLTGTGVALITPFKKDLTIDEKAFLKLLEYTAENGVEYYVVNGTTGESATTNKAEKRRLLELILKNNPKELPVVYGTGGYDTHDIVEHVSEMDWDGVAALLSVSPYYNRPSQRGIIAHYEAVADACPVPVVMYNVPKRTGTNMTSDTTIMLSQHSNIIGIKEASGDLAQVIDIMARKPSDFMMISGDDMLSTAIVALGGDGVISVLANGFPKEMSEMIRLALAGNTAGANQLLYKLNAINPLMYVESSPVGIKQLLAEKAVCDSYVRLPLVGATDQLAAEIRRAMW
jgi:4-hydroxy-tetrahydrodipicolinate synthase